MTARVFMIALLVLASSFAGGCAGPTVGTQSSDVITVEGMINVWGAEPFTGIVLHTDENNTYVLVLDDEERRRLVTPVTARVSGRVYVDVWRGQRFAHLDVTSIESADQ